MKTMFDAIATILAGLNGPQLLFLAGVMLGILACGIVIGAIIWRRPVRYYDATSKFPSQT